MRHSAFARLQQVAGRVDLLEQAKTFSGVVFNPSADIWSYRDGTFDVHIDHTAFGGIHPILADGIRSVLLVRAQKGAATSLMTYYKAFVHFTDFLRANSKCPRKSSKFSVVDYLNYRAEGGV